MSKHFFTKLEQGYLGQYPKQDRGICNIPGCENKKTRLRGPGSRNYCEYHQGLMREYGGFARSDRPWTFHKKTHCEKCGHNPLDNPLVGQIRNELLRNRVRWSLLIVDHKIARKDGGKDTEENTQTLCLSCNYVKTMLAGDSIPDALYNNKEEIEEIKKFLEPEYQKIFG